jgi:hypothetical protein
VVGGALVGGALVGGGDVVGGGGVGAWLVGATVVTGSAESSPDEQAIGPRRSPAAPTAAAPRTSQEPSRDDAVSGRMSDGSVGSEVLFMVRV